MTFAVKPARQLTDPEINQFKTDGVVLIRGALEQNWIDLVEDGIETARKDLSLVGKFMSRSTKGYEMDVFLWKRIDALRDAIYYGPFAHWAQQLMSSKEVRFFYDQMFVKEPGTDAPTPWHQDLSFWPIRGNQICSMWMPLDSVSRESSGLLYVKGSHLWPQRFKAISPDYFEPIIDEEMDDIPDINANPDEYDLLDWDMEPGDILMFHPLTLHGSYGNSHRERRRRAIAFRWIGDDVVYSPSPTRMPINFKHHSTVGGPLRGPAFPRIIPSHEPSERQTRLRPEQPQKMHILKGIAKSVLEKLKGKPATDRESLKQTWN
ncbi:MAG: phytanoyl-CoA dioxygenase family protein [Pseudomonadota bacterium]